MTNRDMSRRQVLVGASLGTLATLAAVGGLSTPAAAETNSPQGQDSVLGAWQVTVTVKTPTTATFDALYAFSEGGAFTRVDGRSNSFVPALGTWRRADDGIEFSYVLFSFDSTGKRAGTITVPSQAAITDGKLTGTFTANGVDTTGHPLPGFPKSGTVTGTLITPDQA